MEDSRACWVGYGLQSHAAWVLAAGSTDLTSLRLRSVRRESQTVVPAVQTAACLSGACPQARPTQSSAMLHQRVCASRCLDPPPPEDPSQED